MRKPWLWLSGLLPGAGIRSVPEPRMLGWLILSFVLLGVIFLLAPQQLPVVIYKLSLVIIAAVLGYWLDRSLFPKSRPGEFLVRRLDEGGVRWRVMPGEELAFATAIARRAAMVAVVIMGVTLGL